MSREITDCLKPLCEARAKQIEALPEDAVDESVYLTRFHIRKVQCPVPSAQRTCYCTRRAHSCARMQALGMHYTRATIDDIMLMFGDEVSGQRAAGGVAPALASCVWRDLHLPDALTSLH